MDNELKSIRRQIAEMKNLLEENAALDDLVNRKKAIEITGLKPKVFTNYKTKGLFEVVCYNKAGQPFFSKKQLTGFDKDKLKIA